jgi:hypothetical protein
MSEWVEVDVNQMNQEVRKDISGVKVKVSFSPYDVPRRYRSYRDPDSKFFVIEFGYLLDERTVPQKASPQAPVELEIGENSKRIYKIKLDTTVIKCDLVKVEIEPLARNVVETIEIFKKTVPEKLQERYKMPEKVVYNDRDRLFSELVV